MDSAKNGSSPIPVLYPKVAFRVRPFYGAFDAGYLAGAAFQTARILHDDRVFLFIEGIEVPGANRQAVSFGAPRPANVVVYDNVTFLIRLEGVDGKLFVDLHVLSHLISS